MKITEVAVGIVHNEAGQLLYAQRPAGKPYAGWWEFPGGKLEQGESVQEALARELAEELGIVIDPAHCQPWLTQQYVYPHAHVKLRFCHVRQFSGVPQSLEGQAFHWAAPDKPPLPFLPAALPVLKMLRLPPVVLQSQASSVGVAAWVQQLNQIDAGTVLIYEPPLTTLDAKKLLTAALEWRNAGASKRHVWISSHFPAAAWGLADGLVLSEQDLHQIKRRPSVINCLASVSSLEGLEHAERLSLDGVIVDGAMAASAQKGFTLENAVAVYKSGNCSPNLLQAAQAEGFLGLVC